MSYADKLAFVLDSIYAGALDAGRWEPCLADISSQTSSIGTYLFAHDLQAGSVPDFRSGGLDPNANTTYNNHYVALDMRLAAVEELPVGEVFTNDTIVDAKTMERSEFYSDFMRPNGLYFVCGSLLFKDADRTAVLGIQRGRHSGDFNSDEVRFVSALVPHLRRALQLQRQFAAVRAERLGSLRLLDQLEVATVLLDNRRNVVALNKCAEDLLAEQDGLMLADNGLCALRATDDTALQRLMTTALECAEGTGTQSGGTMALPRPSGRRPYALLVSPLPRETDFFGGLLSSRPAVAVVLRDPERQAAPLQDLLMSAAGLTQRESALAISLGAGASLREAAEAMGIRYNTARAYLREIFHKTGTRRQSQLIQFLNTFSISPGADQ